MASSQCHRDALKARNTSEKAGAEQPRESGPQPAQVTGLALCGPDIVQLHEALTPSRALDIPASLRASQNNCDLPTAHAAAPGRARQYPPGGRARAESLLCLAEICPEKCENMNMEEGKGSCHACSFTFPSSSSVSVQHKAGLTSPWTALVLPLIYAFGAEISR